MKVKYNKNVQHASTFKIKVKTNKNELVSAQFICAICSIDESNFRKH